MEGGRFSGNPVSGADSECHREVTGKEAASGGTSRASRTTGEDSLSREIIRFRGESVLTSRAGGTAGVHLLPLSSPNSL